MAKIIWEEQLEELSVGVREVDDQHKRFVGFINDLETDLVGEERAAAIAGVLEGLSSYVDYHFGTEEKYFELFEYEGAEEHVHQHRRLTHKVAKYREEFFDQKLDIAAPLKDFLWEWLQEHIKLDDKAYVECFHKNGLY